MVHAPRLGVRPATEADRERWDDAVLWRFGGCPLQTWGWGELRRRHGWTVDRLIAEGPGGEVLGAMTVQTLTRGGLVGFAYSPRGPAVGELAAGAITAQTLVTTAAELARRRRALLLKFDPEWERDDAATADLLAALGSRPSWYDVQHRATYLVDLDGGAEAVLSRVKPSTRRNIRLAERAGVVVEHSGDPAIAASVLHPLVVETAVRNRVVPRSAGYYWDAVACLGASCPTVVLVARCDGEPAAAMVAVACGPRLVYLFGGSTRRFAQRRPAYLLHWEAIRWGLERGCRVYDMWGVPSHEDPRAPHAGYYEFKTRWNGRVVRFVRCQELPLWPGIGPLPRWLERLALRGRPLLT